MEFPLIRINPVCQVLVYGFCPILLNDKEVIAVKTIYKFKICQALSQSFPGLGLINYNEFPKSWGKFKFNIGAPIIPIITPTGGSIPKVNLPKESARRTNDAPTIPEKR